MDRGSRDRGEPSQGHKSGFGLLLISCRRVLRSQLHQIPYGACPCTMCRNSGRRVSSDVETEKESDSWYGPQHAVNAEIRRPVVPSVTTGVRREIEKLKSGKRK